MGLKLSNNATSTLASPISDSATTINVAPGDGALFPTLGAGEWFYVTLIKLVAGEPTYEIVKATARTNDVLTVTRAQDGTIGTTFGAGDRIELRLTAGLLSGEFTRLEAHTDDEITALTAYVDSEVARLEAEFGGIDVNLETLHATILSL